MEDLYIAIDSKNWNIVINCFKNCFKNYYKVLEYLEYENYNINEIIDNINKFDTFLSCELKEVQLYNIENNKLN